MKTISMLGFVLAISLTGVAYAEEYKVEMSTEDGFTPQYLNATHGDKVTFIIRDGEAHDISNPWFGGHNFLNHDNPSITHTFDTCNTYKFDSTFYIDEVFTLDVVNCPVRESIHVIQQNNTVVEPQIIEVPDLELSSAEGFTGWKKEGGEMVAYKDGVRINSFTIFGEEIEMTASTQVPEPRSWNSADNETLSLRLQILEVFENIISMLFGA